MNAPFVFLGGGTGSILRCLVGMWIGSAAIPLATFAVNAVWYKAKLEYVR